jgi:hypothetical protein
MLWHESTRRVYSFVGSLESYLRLRCRKTWKAKELFCLNRMLGKKYSIPNISQRKKPIGCRFSPATQTPKALQAMFQASS